MIKKAWLKTNSDEFRDWLEGGWLFVSWFQDGVGQTPINIQTRGKSVPPRQLGALLSEQNRWLELVLAEQGTLARDLDLSKRLIQNRDNTSRTPQASRIIFVMSISRSPIPSWTAKERTSLVFAFVAAALAAYGVLHLSWIAYLALWETWPDTAAGINEAGFALCLVVFFWALWLMIRGVDAIQRERTRACAIFSGRLECEEASAKATK